jgi:protein O-GlcNAc transferase
VFGERLPREAYLARYRAADLFLDTLPYSAETTASDALWAGLPVLTLAGDTFSGRAAASLLGAIGMPEFVTATPEAFVATAIALATAPTRPRALRQRRDERRLAARSATDSSLASYLEAAYAALCDRHHTGLAPHHIHVPA